MKPELSNIKALVFDAYGTLLDVKSLDAKLTHHFGDQAGAINTVWRQKQLQYTWLRSLMDRYEPFSTVTQEALQFACDQEGVTLTDQITTDLMNGYFELSSFPEVPGLLEKLSQVHSCAILSNADQPMLEKACRKNGITEFLEAILTVDTVKVNKPAPPVYQLAVKKFNCSAEEIAFVSSNTWDVAGARSFGLKVIWLNRSGATMETLGYQPDWIIYELSELL